MTSKSLERLVINSMARLPKSKQLQKNLENLLYETTEYLLEKVKDRELIASDVSNIIKLLKESGVLGNTSQQNSNTNDENNDWIGLDLPFIDDIDDEEEED